MFIFFRLCCSLQHTEPRSPPAALRTALASFSLCSFNRPAKSGPDMSICKNISQVDKSTWRYICKSLLGNWTFLRRFLSTQHHIFIGCLQGMDNIWHYLCLLWQANKCFGISPCSPSSAGSADGLWAWRGERTSCTLVQLH